jgi:hypothetical protein
MNLLDITQAYIHTMIMIYLYLLASSGGSEIKSTKLVILVLRCFAGHVCVVKSQSSLCNDSHPTNAMAS